ncbi:hypothetical protein B4U84_26280 [Westiellopsis prolifica IICB1]|nr:hypothetical protein B4U84_26280 [Westiellopsis prolifica IICB1]
MGFAVLLKFFQLEGRFPTEKSDVPKPVIVYLAKQVSIPWEEYYAYDWQGRAIITSSVMKRFQVLIIAYYRNACFRVNAKINASNLSINPCQVHTWIDFGNTQVMLLNTVSM